jgi:hypothetical protein
MDASVTDTPAADVRPPPVDKLPPLDSIFVPIDTPQPTDGPIEEFITPVDVVRPADAAPVQCEVSPDVATHINAMATGGWAALNRTRGLLMHGCAGATRPQDCLASAPLVNTTSFGAMWTAPVQVEVGTSCGGGRLCDKPWIASGPSTTAGADSLYIVYLQQGQTAADVLAQRSDDGGMTWSAPVVAARAMMSFDGSVLIPNLAQIATGPSGLAAVSWVSLSSSQGSVEGNLVRLGSDANRIFFRRSADGMRTFEATRRVSRDIDSPVYTQPPVALDGNTAHVMYVSGAPTGAWDIILATSTDNGASWRYRKVNDEPDSCATHAFPAMVVDPMTHDVHAVWLENRFGDGAVVYARCPADAARPCGQNEIVSDMPFNFTTSRNPMTWHGDYIGLTLNPSTGDLWATWSDTRQGFPAMYVQRGNAR